MILFRKIGFVRDIAMALFFITIIAPVYGNINKEPVFVMLFAMSVVFLALTAIDIILLLAKVKRKFFFYFNSILQVPVTFILAGLLGIPGLILFVLNLAVLISLKKWKPDEKKSKTKIRK